MSLSTNVLAILFMINLMIFLFSPSMNTCMNAENATVSTIAKDCPSAASPMISLVGGILRLGTDSTFQMDWSFLLENIVNNIWLYGFLMGLVILASYKTGANPLTGGGGMGSMLTLQILGITLFASLALVPNFHVMGFPAMIEFILYTVFGGVMAFAIVGMLKGTD